MAVGLAVGLAVGDDVLGAAVGARVRQIVYPARVTEPSVSQVKVWPVLTATLLGPVVPQYFWLPIRIQS